MQLSEAEIREAYAQGEEAVVSLVTLLLERLNKLGARVKELEDRLNKNSRNSNKPPSGDGYGKRTTSLRGKSDKPSGGQAGHQGQTLEWRSEADCVEKHEVNECTGCGASLATVPVDEVLARQVFDIPPIELLVTEHQVEVKCCPKCGHSSQGSFPAEASNVVQYGPRIKGMIMYLMEGQLLPSHRTCEVLKDLLNVKVSEGTLYTTREQCFEHLAPIEQGLHQAIKDAEVVHFDETGMRVNQRLWWLHVASSNGLTYYFVHPKRGQVAMDEMDILPEFEGKAVHDGWQSYRKYECEHFLCNAHHLRELQYILERYGQWWAFQMSLLLVTIHYQVEALKAQGEKALSSEDLAAFEIRYEAILEQGLAENPMSTPLPEGGKKRGRAKRSPPRNLLERLKAQKASVLGFMYDFTIPFDNNQAERDLRMMKLKQKISGCFRSEEGARRFCRIRGYLSTLRKQGHNVLDALIDLFSGNPQSPLTQPE
ncbi:MAG: IS66 family transposase [Cyanothece sp. SIO1E1]|nr:IS66 family transposase [Cyanothece sp. SIO1E1]